MSANNTTPANMQRLSLTRQEVRVDKAAFDDIKDLQLAAELGRTLLERNEELENELKQQQVVIDDQAQEIEYLTKQTSSMKEESSSRAKFYEQLESTIIELERTNTQLSRKHEVDKKRIQSLCENIDYLERKCEEMSGTIDSIRNESNKRRKLSKNNYIGFGSDSSEEEWFSSFSRRRTQSLQDLRDLSSCDGLDSSGNSNSPDLRTSEAEFIESLETRVEELLSAKKKETDKIHQLETQMRILIQENANLQQQLLNNHTEKDEQITELRKQLLDSSSYIQPFPTSTSLSSLPFMTSSRRTSEYSNPGTSLPHNPNSMCKRCSTEINLLNLVNSIEVENDPEPIDEAPAVSGDDDVEFSSLEHELARATGFNMYTFATPPSQMRHRKSHPPYRGSQNRRSGRKSNPFANISLNAPDFENTEGLLDLFFTPAGRMDFGLSEGVQPIPLSEELLASSSSCDDEGESSREEDEEDSCIRKDRHPEFSKGKSGKSKMRSVSSTSGCSSGGPTTLSSSGASTSSGHDSSRQGSPVCTDNELVVKTSKFLELPRRIPTDDEEEDEVGKELDCRSDNIAEEPPVLQGDSAQQVTTEESGLKKRSKFLKIPSSRAVPSYLAREAVLALGSPTTGPEDEEFNTLLPPPPPVPEYKHILNNMFSLFNSSRRKYPIPMYPIIHQARRTTTTAL